MFDWNDLKVLALPASRLSEAAAPPGRGRRDASLHSLDDGAEYKALRINDSLACIPDNAIDMVFVDPPFGSNIFLRGTGNMDTSRLANAEQRAPARGLVIGS